MAGVGSSPISVNQSPAYGDKTALDSASKTMTKTPMTGNPTPAPTAGRPPGSGQPQQPAPQATPASPDLGVPKEHMEMMDKLADAYRTKVFWDNVLKYSPSEWTRLYAADANREYNMLASQMRSGTPFFEA